MKHFKLDLTKKVTVDDEEREMSVSSRFGKTTVTVIMDGWDFDIEISDDRITKRDGNILFCHPNCKNLRNFDEIIGSLEMVEVETEIEREIREKFPRA